MTTIVIKRNRKGEITGYHHVGRHAKWFAHEPRWCPYMWGRSNRLGLRLRSFYGFEFEVGERVAARFT